MHALVELDVGEAQRRLRGTGEHVSWTGFVVASVARAVAAHPGVNARRAGSRIVTFDRVDVGATVEREWQGRRVLDVVTLVDADRMTCAETTRRLHTAKYGPTQPHPATPLVRLAVRLPGPLRRSAIRLGATSPRVAATFGPAVGVTSVGMFSDGWGWAVPQSPLTVIATVGGVLDRPVARAGEVVVRPMLPLTLTFDHAVVDGAPAARFTETLRRIVESAAALDDAE